MVNGSGRLRVPAVSALSGDKGGRGCASDCKGAQAGTDDGRL